MGRFLWTLALASACSASASGQTGVQPKPEPPPAAASAQPLRPDLKVGDAAPELAFERLLQAPVGAAADRDGLKGKVVILEFWATWCYSCVPAFKHLNALAERFKGRPVQFIAVTDEADENQVRQFLKEVPVGGWVALDTDGSVFERYRVSGRPHTVVLGPDGRVAAITYPEHLSPAALDDLLAGKAVSLPAKPLSGGTPGGAGGESRSKPLFKISIEPAATGGGLTHGPTWIEADGVAPLAALSAAYRVPAPRIVSSLPLARGFYKISAVVPEGQEERLPPALQQAMEATFGLKVRRELREVDVLVLSRAGAAAAGPQPSRGGERGLMAVKGVFRAKGQPIKLLASTLEEVFLRRPVLDETGLGGEYDWEMPYNRASNKVLLAALRERLGLELTEARRTIEVLVVESAAPGGAAQK